MLSDVNFWHSLCLKVTCKRSVLTRTSYCPFYWSSTMSKLVLIVRFLKVYFYLKDTSSRLILLTHWHVCYVVFSRNFEGKEKKFRYFPIQNAKISKFNLSFSTKIVIFLSIFQESVNFSRYVLKSISWYL